MNNFKIDLHIHTQASKDSDLSVDTIVKKLMELDFNGMCITDHDIFEKGCPVENYKYDNFLILKGVEYSSADGHLLLYGVGDDSFMQMGKYQPAQKIIDTVTELGGVAIPSHPYLDWWKLVDRKDGIPNPPKEDFNRVMQDKLKTLNGLVAIESLNAALTRLQPDANERAQAVAKSIGLKEIGGSDAHKPFEIGCGGTLFEDTEISCMADLIFALKHTNYYPISEEK